MTPLLEDLAKKFENHRKKTPGRKTNYPVKLIKSATRLFDNGIPLKELESSLSVSESAIRSWVKKYQSSAINQSDIIPVEIDPVKGEATQEQEANNNIPLRLIYARIVIPRDRLTSTLKDLLSGIGTFILCSETTLLMGF